MTNTMLTREGYDKLVAELDYLRNVKELKSQKDSKRYRWRRR